VLVVLKQFKDRTFSTIYCYKKLKETDITSKIILLFILFLQHQITTQHYEQQNHSLGTNFGI
jgi:hypothetical protein